MADVAVSGIAKSVLKQLASPAMDELKLLWNHTTELENLKNTITTISMVLQDAERQQAKNNAVRVWLERLKVALYDADDFFDTISAKDLHHKAKCGSHQKGIQQVVSLPFSRMYHFSFVVKSAHKVKDIRKRIDVIAKDIKDFGFLSQMFEQDHPERTRRETTHSYVPSNEVVGRDQEREDIVRMLLTPPAEPEGVPVIAVIGFGGLGKTTIAQLVYGDDKIQQSFDLRMWACINDFSCLNQVLMTLVDSVTESKAEASTESLQSKFRKAIDGKRFLLVLDDVWDEDPLNWRKLKILLDFGKPGSMVLATTRSVRVAKSMLADEPYYHLHGISDESAYTLFKKIAFQGKRQKQNNSRLEELGQQIVNKCGNVPLLIVTIASFLRDQEEKKWRSLVDGEFPTVVPGDYTKVMEALKISYREFPYPVKRCFAICSMFPKDYEFDKDKLIRLWIAEGYIEIDDVDQSLEDKAEEYWFFLVDRCFFQKSKSFTFHFLHETYKFQMHDLVHDLAKEVAGSESFSNDGISAKKQRKVWDNSIRHVSLIASDWPSFPRPKCNLRTFLCFNGAYEVANHCTNKLIWNFKALRVLDLSELKIKEIPAYIGKLTHLRLLDLSFNKMERLPSSICSLHHLQSLLLRGCRNLRELPEEIGRLVSMRHLILDIENFVEMPAGFAALTSLVALSENVVHKPGGYLKYFTQLNNLSGTMRLLVRETGWEDVITDAKSASLSRKSRLKEIKFEFNEEEHGGQVDALLVAFEPHRNLEHLKIESFGGSEIPQWISRLDRLVSLSLYRCEGVAQLPPLSRIRSLKELRLKMMSSLLVIEGPYDPEFAFFPSLETLELWCLPNLRGWWVQEPAMLPKFPRVTHVYIASCQELEIGCMPRFELIVEDLKLASVKDEVVWGIEKECSSALESLTIDNTRGLSIMRVAQTWNSFKLTPLSTEEYNAEESLFHLFKPLNLNHLEIPKASRVVFENLKSLTSLETLRIIMFDDDGVDKGATTPWQFLQRLHTLDISFGMGFSTRGILDGVEHLTNSLKDLRLSLSTDLYLPWTSVLSLRLLEKLEFHFIERVIHVGSIQQPQLISTSLRELRIWHSSAEWIVNIPWMSLPSLQLLRLVGIRDLEALPQGIQHLSSLQRLELSGLRRVTSLPCWISSLSSLQELYMYGSSEELKKRCQKPTGEDWPLIQHIRSFYTI